MKKLIILLMLSFIGSISECSEAKTITEKKTVTITEKKTVRFLDPKSTTLPKSASLEAFMIMESLAIQEAIAQALLKKEALGFHSLNTHEYELVKYYEFCLSEQNQQNK